MPRNKLSDLNDYLFEQIERINDDELTGCELEEQLKKSKMVVNVANAITRNAAVSLAAYRVFCDTDEDPIGLFADRRKALGVEV